MNARLENIKSCNILHAYPPPLRPPDAFAEPLVSLPSAAQDTLLVLRSIANQNITPLVTELKAKENAKKNMVNTMC